jgi:flagellar motor switch protein FliG
LLSTLSSRAAQTINDEIADMGPVKRADVDDAQKAVVAVARKMAASGEIMLGGKSDDYV